MAKLLAGAVTVDGLASAMGARSAANEEAAIVAELRAGSEQAYAWLITHYHQPVYSLVYRMLNDPADAADTTQEVFLKVFRHIKRFHGDSSLKTWIYRIAVHEASNQRRWWFRHKRRESSMETPCELGGDTESGITLEDSLVDPKQTPFDLLAHEEVRAKVEAELREVPEPYRTAVVLRDIEGLAYEEIAQVLNVSLGTVKSRLMRGRDALRKRLAPYVAQVGSDELGLEAQTSRRSACDNPTEVETRR